METFLLEVPGATQARRVRVQAARWVCTDDFHLTSFDDKDKEIESWNPQEWIRLIEEPATGDKIVTRYVNLGKSPSLDV